MVQHTNVFNVASNDKARSANFITSLLSSRLPSSHIYALCPIRLNTSLASWRTTFDLESVSCILTRKSTASITSREGGNDKANDNDLTSGPGKFIIGAVIAEGLTVRDFT
ncbi:hypothetical protein WG66_010753 [Moniliophthora roreri]|nr:hypothetical protein WG66_010753 [Moniliophthora roreri]